MRYKNLQCTLQNPRACLKENIIVFVNNKLLYSKSFQDMSAKIVFVAIFADIPLWLI